MAEELLMLSSMAEESVVTLVLRPHSLKSVAEATIALVSIWLQKCIKGHQDYRSSTPHSMPTRLLCFYGAVDGFAVKLCETTDLAMKHVDYLALSCLPSLR